MDVGGGRARGDGREELTRKAWSALFAAHAATSDERENEEDKRRLMLERFQMENPGFDFSRASFNGQAARIGRRSWAVYRIDRFARRARSHVVYID